MLVKSFHSDCSTGVSLSSSIPHAGQRRFRKSLIHFACCKAWTTSASPCSDRYEIATSAPSRAYASATALPMPESPPVTRAFCAADPHSLMRQAPLSCQTPST